MVTERSTRVQCGIPVGCAGRPRPAHGIREHGKTFWTPDGHGEDSVCKSKTTRTPYPADGPIIEAGYLDSKGMAVAQFSADGDLMESSPAYENIPGFPIDIGNAMAIQASDGSIVEVGERILPGWATEILMARFDFPIMES